MADLGIFLVHVITRSYIDACAAFRAPTTLKDSTGDRR